MGAWLSNVSLKYKFWAVNAVAFVTTLLLVVYAVHLEQRARAEVAQVQAVQQAELLAVWPSQQPIPRQANVISWSAGQTPTFAGEPLERLRDGQGWVDLPGAWVLGDNPLRGAQVVRSGNQYMAVVAPSPSLRQVFFERFSNYAVCVLILMLAMLAASQLLIRFLLSQLNTLKDVILHVEKPATWQPVCHWPVVMRSARWPVPSMPCRPPTTASSAPSPTLPRSWTRALRAWPPA